MSEGLSAPYVAQDNEHQRLSWLGESVLTVLVDAAVSNGQLTIVRTDGRLGDSAPLHVHTREDELFLMLQGSGTFWVGDTRKELSDGGVAWLPRDVPHTYRIDSEEAHFLTICTPSGFEGFFRAAGHDLSTPRAPDWAITPTSMSEALVAHGGKILGPPKLLND